MALETSGAHLSLHSPLSDSAPANTYWSVDAAIQYGDTTILKRDSGVFDTGTSLFGLATSMLLRDP
jgi:saccharopepsin